MGVINYKMACKNCGGHVEFESEYQGATVPCPHCAQEILLFNTHSFAPPPARPAIINATAPNQFKPLAICLMILSAPVAIFEIYQMISNQPTNTMAGILAVAVITFIGAIVLAGGVKYEGYDGSKAPENSAARKHNDLAYAIGGVVVAASAIVKIINRGAAQSVEAVILLAALIALSLAIYFLPSYLAYKRNHKNLLAIAALNVLTGWTFVGWVISLVWALKVE
ncbi:MAG TPA: superinfection immunity protein [Verrucomicrobiae bacterium]|nr:superinfection immunity protein [Verrucomicrobiae bacterium]